MNYLIKKKMKLIFFVIKNIIKNKKINENYYKKYLNTKFIYFNNENIKLSFK